MTDNETPETRKQQIHELRVSAGAAKSNKALLHLNEADRRLALGGVDNMADADKQIGLARALIAEAKNEG